MQIVPITELRNTNAISEKCHKENEPIFITKNGYGDMVVMSIETYNKLMFEQQIDSAIAESELDSDDELIDARMGLSELRRKHFGN